MGLSGTAIGTYRPQYRPLSAICYLDVNPLPTRYTLFITLLPQHERGEGHVCGWRSQQLHCSANELISSK
jgi:hypothetical protein